MSLSDSVVNRWIRYSIYSGTGWLVIGIILSLLINNAYSNMFIFIEFFILSFSSLFFLTKLMADLIREDITGAMVWGFLKMTALGVTIWRMTDTNEKNGLALALGVGTLFVVPMSSAFIEKLKIKRN